MIYANEFNRCCYVIFTGLIFDYKEQVFIIKIKKNVQYSIYYVFLQKLKNLTK